MPPSPSLSFSQRYYQRRFWLVVSQSQPPISRLLITVLARNFRPREIIRKVSSNRRDLGLYTLPYLNILFTKEYTGAILRRDETRRDKAEAIPSGGSLSLCLSLSSDILTHSFIHSFIHSLIHSLIHTPSSSPSKPLSTYSTTHSNSNSNITSLTLHLSSPYQIPPRWSKVKLIHWRFVSKLDLFIYSFIYSIDRSIVTNVVSAYILLLLLFSTRPGVIVVFGWKEKKRGIGKGKRGDGGGGGDDSRSLRN